MDVLASVDLTFDCLFILFIILGTVGNILVFRVYWTSEKLNKNSFAIYFKVLPLVDQLMIFDGIRYLMGHSFKLVLVDKLAFFCHILDYFEYILSPISGYLLVCISFDRFMQIKYQNKFRIIFDRRYFQIPLILFIFLFNSLFYIGFLWNKQYVQTTNTDNTTNVTVFEWSCIELDGMSTIYQMDIYNSTLIPFVLMITFSVLTIYLVIKSRTRINVTSSVSQSLSKKDKKFAILSISLNFLYLIFNLPTVLTIAYGSSMETNLFNTVKYALNVWYYINYGSNFYIHVIFNNIFRNDLFKIAHIKSSNKVSNNYTGSVVN